MFVRYFKQKNLTFICLKHLYFTTSSQIPTTVLYPNTTGTSAKG